MKFQNTRDKGRSNTFPRRKSTGHIKRFRNQSGLTLSIAIEEAGRQWLNVVKFQGKIISFIHLTNEITSTD